MSSVPWNYHIGFAALFIVGQPNKTYIAVVIQALFNHVKLPVLPWVIANTSAV